MKSRKVLVLVLGLILLVSASFSLVGCSTGEQVVETETDSDADAPETDSDADAPETEGKTDTSQAGSDDIMAADRNGDGKVMIGISVYSAGACSYHSTYEATARKTCEDLGVEFTILDGNCDAVKQNNDIADLIQQNVDGIVCWPLDGETIAAAYKEAYDAGIPIINSNSMCGEEAMKYIVGHSGIDDYDMAYRMGDAMAKVLDKDAIVLGMTGFAGNFTAMQRAQGYTDAMNDNGIEVQEVQPTDDNREKAQSVMEDYLVKYPHIDAVCSANTDTLFGAMNAIKDADLPMGIENDGLILGGVDIFAIAYPAFQEGLIYASCFQDPRLDGEQGVDTLMRYLKGEEIEFYTYFDTPLYTYENRMDCPEPCY
jgi:ribose transport system substrate-binding protein